MRVMAQMGMVMNLDKCIGCHTCSVTCKQAWTNRSGVEYAWFNNVETRPGQGYPRRWEDQERWDGGWVRTSSGRLELRSGGRTKRMLRIFSNPTLPGLSDYYEPWTYDYDVLLSAPAQADTPVARPKSLITGEPMAIRWSANWDDDLGGAPEHAPSDPVLQKIGEQVRLSFEQAFMYYLPRICEHCLNPSCVAACPSGAMYKRAEDGIVLVDQDGCRGWRMCVSGCPYKKVYFNHKTGKAEKCTFCYPRVEAGQPTVCAETCVGRLRYIGLFLYDADRVLEAASVEDPRDLLEAQRSVILDPEDPTVIAGARAAGIAEDWIEAARHSPVYALTNRYRIALPLRPEWRTMPMVWYIPPLSPVVDAVAGSGFDGEDRATLFAAIGALRIPVEYLAEQFSAGDPAPVEHSLRVLAAMRSHMRRLNLGEPDGDAEADAASVGFTPRALEDLFRLLAIAKYEDRYVIPAAHVELAASLDEAACSLDFEGGPGMGGYGAFGQPPSTPISVESFHLTRQRAAAERYADLPEVRGAVARAPDAGGDRSLVLAVAARVLQYPDEELTASLPVLDEAVAVLPATARAPLARVVDHLGSRPLIELQAQYVATFDLRRRNALYLTYHLNGDTRRRGLAIWRFGGLYRSRGYEPAAGELGDFLPAALELAAGCDAADTGVLDAIAEHLPSVIALRRSLEEDGSPYADAVRAVELVLPEPSRSALDAVDRLVAEGPPVESVGLDPFAMPGTEARP